MRRLIIAGTVLTGVLLAFAPSAMAAPNLDCNGVFVGGVYHDVNVPENGSCVLNGTTVENNAKAKKNAYLELNGGSVGHDVTGDKAVTVFVHDGVVIGHNLQATHGTQQLFAFDSSLTGDGSIKAQDVPKAFGQVNICGMTVSNGNIQVENSGHDILVGDPFSGCNGNSISDNVNVKKNQTDVELIVRGNTVGHDMQVNDNKGPSDKAVENNTGGNKLDCHGNQAPFTASGNSGWAQKKNQCSGP